MASYATLNQLKSAIGVSTTDTTQDDYLEDILARVTDWIDTYTSRTWQGPKTVTNAEYDLPTNDQGIFYLRRTDIQSITSLQIGSPFNPSAYQTLTAGTDFVWNSTGRVIIPQYSAQWIQGQYGDFATPVGPISSFGAIKVSYTYGISAPTKTIEHACVDIAGTLYTNQASQGLKQERVGDYHIVYQDQDMMNAAAGADQLRALDHLKLRHV